MKLFGIRAPRFGARQEDKTAERNSPPLIGYARTAPGETTLETQLKALKAAGCTEVFSDGETSGSPPCGSQLLAALEQIKAGDCLVVSKLDRLGHSIPHLLKLLSKLAHDGITVRALEQGVDTSAATAEAQTALINALAECERAKASERTRAGISNARRNGVRVGRRPALSRSQVELARDLVAAGRLRKDVAATFGVSLPTLRRSLRSGDDH